jgi:hypothetical protein
MYLFPVHDERRDERSYFPAPLHFRSSDCQLLFQDYLEKVTFGPSSKYIATCCVALQSCKSSSESMLRVAQDNCVVAFGDSDLDPAVAFIRKFCILVDKAPNLRFAKGERVFKSLYSPCLGKWHPSLPSAESQSSPKFQEYHEHGNWCILASSVLQSKVQAESVVVNPKRRHMCAACAITRNQGKKCILAGGAAGEHTDVSCLFHCVDCKPPCHEREGQTSGGAGVEPAQLCLHKLLFFLVTKGREKKAKKKIEEGGGAGEQISTSNKAPRSEQAAYAPGASNT